MHARPFAAVHVERQADDERRDGVLIEELEQTLRVRRELHPADGLERRRDAALDVRDREPDRLRAEIDAHEPRVTREGREKIGEIDAGIGGHARA